MGFKGLVKKVIGFSIVFLIALGAIVFADNTGRISPTTFVESPNKCDDSNQAYTDNDQYASCGKEKYNWWGNYDFSSIPNGSTIDGIIVELKDSYTKPDATSYAEIKLSWNDRSSWTTAKKSNQIIETSTPGGTYTLGNSSDTWGHSWTTDEINNSFWVEWKTVNGDSDEIYVDWLPVTVYYTLPNTAPSITTPTISPSPAYSSSQLNCSTTPTDAEQSTLNVSFTWYKNNIQDTSQDTTLSCTSGETCYTDTLVPSSSLTKNDNWVCSARAYDGSLYSYWSNSSSLTISNTQPSIASASITPDPAYTTSTLTCNNGTTSDADADSITLSYQWYKDNVIISGQTSQTLSSTNFNKNDQIICEITPNDGTNNGAAVNSTALTISNSAPTIYQSLSLIPPSPKTTNSLTCSFTITDQDAGDSLTANITWYKNSAIYSSTSQSVTNGTEASSILDSSNTAKNEEWNCTIIPYDGTAYGNPDSSSVTIQNTAPTAPNISITPPSPITTNDLNVVFNSVSQDNDSDAITYTYLWYKNSVLQPSLTTSTVSSDLTSKNEVWLVNVTPNDGTINGEKDTSTVTIQNSLPIIDSASITPTTAYKTSTLTASAQGWSDLDGESEYYIYQWSNQNGKINGAISSTLTGTNFNKSDQIYCNVTPYDSDDYGTSKLTNTVTIQNSLPTLTINLVTELGLNGTDEDLIASFTYSDEDSDTITNNQTKWYKNNIEQTNLADLTTISYTNTSTDDIWTFSARAYDGEVWSIWYNTSITILDISQTYPTLLSPSNGTYFNTSNVVLTYTTPNYQNMNCTIYADININPITPIKNNTNIQSKTTIIYNWRNIADNKYYWKAGCTNNSILYNSTIKSFTIDTTYPITAPTLTQNGVADSDNDGNIELSWTADPDANTYNIYRSSTQIINAENLTKIASTSLTSYEDNSTLHNNTYWYALTTIDTAGNENKSIVSDSFNTTSNDTIKPKLPTNVNASSLNGIITIYWTKVKQDINGNSDESNLQYKIWYAKNSTVNLSKSLVNETADYIKTISQNSCSASSCSTTHSLSNSKKYYYFITTIDDANNENLTLDNNYANVTATIAPPGGGGSGGGGGGGGGGRTSTPKKECKEDWSCSEWYSCVKGIQARTCIDVNHCGTEYNKPKETRPCAPCIEKWQCGDWTPCVNNRQTRVCIDKNDCGTEKNKPTQERDCMLNTCSDGIKNYGEVGIDCGGPCRPCEAKDFITGSAIKLKATEGPNPFLLIPTIFLLITFIFLRTIRKSDVKFRRTVSALHVPMVILIVVLLIFSFFGPQITGLFTAGNETIKEQEYTIDSETAKIDQVLNLNSIIKSEKRNIKITSTISFTLIAISLIGLIAKNIPKIKTKSKEKAKKIEEKREEKLPIKEIKDIEIEITPHKPTTIKEEPFYKEEIQEIKPNKQEILNQIKESYKLDQINGKIKNFP